MLIALTTCLGGIVAPAFAKDDPADAINALQGADAKARLAIVKRLAPSRTERTATALCKIARFDAAANVRVAAAEALAAFDDDVAIPSLKELLTEGGIREVRRHAAIGMSKRPKGLAWIVGRIGAKGIDAVERVLLVSELGHFPSMEAAGEIERLVASDDPAIRTAALRALAVHPIGRHEAARVVVEVLTNATDAETILAALDVADGVLDREIRDLLPGLMAGEDRRIRNAAENVSRRLDYQDALARRAKAAKDGYAPNDPPPVPVPSSRAKVDVVYIYDDTGSMGGIGKQRCIRFALDRAAQEEGDLQVSYRHGWVAMQDTQREAWDPPTRYFAPVFDSLPYRNVTWRNQAAAVDTEGIAVGAVLRGVLDRFEWRPGAERRVVVVSDTYIGDPEDAQRTVSVHFAADGLTLDVGYVGFGINRNRISWRDLFVAGGGVLPPEDKK
jgi:hypothetical protein